MADKIDLLGRRSREDGVDSARGAVGALLGGVSDQRLEHVPITRIRVTRQVRREFSEDGHRALMENIRAQGRVVEPVILNRVPGEDMLVLVAGERRVRALRALVREYEEAGDAERAERFGFVPAIVYEDLSPERVMEFQLSENLLREDLTDLEETLALCDLLAVRLGVASEEVPSLLERLEKEARRARRESEGFEERRRVVEETFREFSSVSWRTYVKKRIHLLRMPADVVASVREGRLSSAQAELVMRLPDERMREQLTDRVERTRMPLEELTEAVNAVLTKPVTLQPEHVQVAIRVKKRLTPKRLTALPPEARLRVQELLEEVDRLMGGESSGGGD